MSETEWVVATLLLASVTLNVLLIVLSNHLWRAQRRCYSYAANMADWFWTDEDNQFEFGKSCAYSDMATVITLDGKVEDPRLDAPPRRGAA